MPHTLRIPFADLYAVNRRYEHACFRGLRDLYRRSAFVGGPWVQRFESEFAAALGARYCVAVASGTAALHLALAAAGIGRGDEVIVPAFTFPGTAWGVLYQGARPVFADVRPEDGCLDPGAVARALTRRTKAIVAVHLFGHPAAIGPLQGLARDCGAWLVEDAAQAHGGFYRGRPLGSLGDCGCFSFYPTKNLGAMGDAGAVATRRAGSRRRLQLLRDHGQAQPFRPETLGFNARMDAVQALFLSLKLPGLAAANLRRAAIARRYLRALSLRPDLIPLRPSAEGVSAWHAFVIRARRRAAFARYLDQRGIGQRVYYPATLPGLKPFRAFARGRYPAAEELARTAIALPLHAGLTQKAVGLIAAALREFNA